MIVFFSSSSLPAVYGFKDKILHFKVTKKTHKLLVIINKKKSLRFLIKKTEIYLKARCIERLF